MRRLLLPALVLVLALPAAAGALRRAPGDGTLVVQAGQGLVLVQARGGIIGRFDSGQVVIEDPFERDGGGPIVFGAEQIRELGPRRTLYIGRAGVRFRLIGGAYRVRVEAIGIDLSAVGRGFVILDGSRFRDFPGRFSINGGPFQPLPPAPTRLPLGAPPPGTLGR